MTDVKIRAGDEVSWRERTFLVLRDPIPGKPGKFWLLGIEITGMHRVGTLMVIDQAEAKRTMIASDAANKHYRQQWALNNKKTKDQLLARVAECDAAGASGPVKTDYTRVDEST